MNSMSPEYFLEMVVIPLLPWWFVLSLAALTSFSATAHETSVRPGLSPPWSLIHPGKVAKILSWEWVKTEGYMGMLSIFFINFMGTRY